MVKPPSRPGDIEGFARNRATGHYVEMGYGLMRNRIINGSDNWAG
jgi:hypothetical protein